MVRATSVLFLVPCVACASPPARTAPRDAAVPSSEAAAPPSTGAPFFTFDAAMPVCATPAPSRLADAGPVPARDCGTSPPVSFMRDIQPLLQAHCTGEVCHESTWAGSPHEYEDLVGTPTPECCDGRKRIDPVHPERSYLLQKLDGTDLCAGTKMPRAGSIPQADIDEIARWICQGAPKN